MHTISKVAILSCLVKTLLPAAYSHSVMSDSHSFFGIATSSQGASFAVFPTFVSSAEAPTASLIFVYSPNDDAADECIKFARSIESQQRESVRRIAQFIREHRAGRTALFVRLGKESVEIVDGDTKDCARRLGLEEYKSVVLVSNGLKFEPVVYEQKITEICDEVLSLQQGYPKAPFHVLVDLMHWDATITSIKGNAQLHQKYTKRLRLCGLL